MEQKSLDQRATLRKCPRCGRALIAQLGSETADYCWSCDLYHSPEESP